MTAAIEKGLAGKKGNKKKSLKDKRKGQLGGAKKDYSKKESNIGFKE